ncbi:simple sugar transport system permease protein [Nocardiopsis mwathae]|uniref:Xylose transport system permease protein XylH n=1 Tax=Nocardiopsis mwathae TaxID=1472723 RepID=A0A7X0D6N2_9ACTN|nr:ABC transporter permease [Nocardiopsis mwathae]MBB6173732.1 simple sugar transport system permease protein [Nocardiopsis mwathae]
MSHTLTLKEPPAPEASEKTLRVGQRSFLRRFMSRPEMGSLLGAIVVFAVFFSVAEPFRQASSLMTVLYASSIIGIMAVGVALLMIGGEFDLSAGVAVITASLTAAILSFQLNLNVWVGAGLALALALTIGFINGLILVRTKLPSFLVTLSMFLMLQGLNIAVTKLITGKVSTDSIRNMDGFASAQMVFSSSVPIPGLGVSVRITVLWWLLFAALATWVLMRTKVGNWIYAVGGNAESARAVGVPVARVKIGLFMTVGFFAWFSGMHLLMASGVQQSGEGVGNELLYIMAAVVGGCLLTGGYGTVIGAVIGALIYGMTKQGIVYAGWDNNWIMFFVGAMLLLAVVVNMWVRNQTSKR